MPRLTNILLSILTVLFFVSCQKEISDVQAPANQNNLLGDYKFISMDVNTRVTQELTLGGDVEKTVTVSNYTTNDNSGTITFDATSFISKDLAYSFATVAKIYLYTNGALVDSLELPFQSSLPPFSSSSPYKMVGADSIYFSGGTLVTGGATQQVGPNGARLRFEGTKLFLTSRYNNNTTTSTQGITVLSTQQATTVITLQKL